MARSLFPVLVTGAAAVVSVVALYLWLPPNANSDATQWLPQVVVTLLGLVGASWFAYRRLELLAEGNHQHKQASDRRLELLAEGNRQHKQASEEQLAATERGNLNGAIKEADDLMSKPTLSSIIAGQRWLHHLAEDDRLDRGLLRSLLCAYIVSNDSSLTSNNADTDGVDVQNETRQRTRQAALEMIFGLPGRERYSYCKDKPELGSCTWSGLNFSDLDVSGANFKNGDFTDVQISAACCNKSDLRETKWSGHVGGLSRTSMHEVDMRGVRASSCIFENISFRGAIMSRSGPVTRFIHCTFKNCDFSGATWSGAEFVNPNFDGCVGINFELCQNAKLKNPSGLPNKLLEDLRSKGVGGY